MRKEDSPRYYSERMTENGPPHLPDVLPAYDVRTYHFFWAIVVPLGVVVLVIAVAVILMIITGSIGPFLPLLFFPIIVTVMLAGTWRTEAYLLTLRADRQLEWKAIRRAGHLDLQDIRSIHSSYPPWLNIVSIEAAGQNKVIRIAAVRGFREFVSILQSRNPSIHVRLDWGARVAERLPWPSAFRQRRVGG